MKTNRRKEQNTCKPEPKEIKTSSKQTKKTGSQALMTETSLISVASAINSAHTNCWITWV